MCVTSQVPDLIKPRTKRDGRNMQVGNSAVPFRHRIPIVAQICRTVTPKQVNIKYVLLGIIELNMVYISFWSTALLNSVLNGIYLQHFYKLIKRSNLDLFHLADLLHISNFHKYFN